MDGEIVMLVGGMTKCREMWHPVLVNQSVERRGARCL